MDKVYTQHWINLEKPVREHLRKVFSVARSGVTEVRDQTLISDGTNNDDLNAAFTKATMEAYVGVTESFPHLWDLSVSKATMEVFGPKPIVMNMDSILVSPNQVEIVKEITSSTTPKFCNFCDAKAVRHKSDCTNPNVKDGFEQKVTGSSIISPSAEVKNE